MNPLDSIWGTIISGFVVAVILALILARLAAAPAWQHRPVVALSIGGNDGIYLGY